MSSKLTAEVVSIGDEMTSGARVDTNSQWLSQKLGELGIKVNFHSTVGDDLQANIDVFRTAAFRADIVIATGGLGPTRDDLTREALSALVDRPLELRDEALQHIQSLFALRNRPMPQRNRVQAMFPAESLIIDNPQGTAPGVDMTVPIRHDRSSRVFALPGVPAEMKRMFHETVAPRIIEMSGSTQHIQHLVLKFFGTGESDMEQRLGEMIARDREPRVGITVSAATISLRITATADSPEKCEATIAETRAEIMDRVGDLYFGEGETYEQYHAINAALRTAQEKLFVVELGCATPLADAFASLGATPAYAGGVSFASTDGLLRLTGADDPKTAISHLKERFSAEWLLLVDSYPDLAEAVDAALPATEVTLTVSPPDGKSLPTTTRLGGHPAIIQQRIGKAAMQWFRKCFAAHKTTNE